MYRRTLLAGLAATPLLSARHASAAAAPLKLGVLTDMSGIYSDYLGPGSVIAAQLAIEDFGGKLGEREILAVAGDHQNKVDVGSALARQWIDTDGVDVIMDVPNSAVALSVAQIALDKNRVFIGSGAGTAELTGKRCSPNTIHWTYDTWETGHALGRAVVEQGGKKWFFLTADYTFGHDLQKNVSEAVIAAGGSVAGSANHPLGSTDFAQYLVQATSSGADVLALANAGDDTVNAMKQAAEFGLTKSMKLAGPLINVNFGQSLGLAALSGVLIVSPFYWDSNEATRAFAARFAARHPRHNMPNDMQAGVYASTLAYLHAVAALNGASEDGGKVVAQMKRASPAEDKLFGASTIREDGRVTHPVMLMQAKTPAESKGGWDYFKLLSTIPPDLAYRPLSEGGCPLVKT
jgi:branched-chain amino acid transport system substrate-binding protein